MQYQLIIKDANGNVVVETDFMSPGPIDMIPTSDWQNAMEAFVQTARMLHAMTPGQVNYFLEQFIGPEAKKAYKKAA